MIKVRYEEMFPEDFEKALKENPTAYLPLGSLEYHGFHNVLGLDSLKAWSICELAAKEIGGVVFPPLFLGVDAWPDIDLGKYPNKKFDCYHVPADLYKKFLKEYFYRIKRIGFKTIFVLCGHYPNADSAREVAKGFERIKIVVKTEADLVEGEKGDHAGVWETSLMMVLFPKMVDLKRMEGKENRLMAVNGEDPIKSSKEHGEEMLQKIITGIEESLGK